ETAVPWAHTGQAHPSPRHLPTSSHRPAGSACLLGPLGTLNDISRTALPPAHQWADDLAAKRSGVHWWPKHNHPPHARPEPEKPRLPTAARPAVARIGPGAP